jgi:hypothetical protein
MSDDLSQSDADALLSMEKHRVNDEDVQLPSPEMKLIVELRSSDAREKSNLDINRGRLSLSKVTYQTRARVVYVLARLDIDGPPHTNPDDQQLPCPHLHLYREGYGHKWAIPVPPEHFRDLSDRWLTLEDFMSYCRIVNPPRFVRDFFS